MLIISADSINAVNYDKTKTNISLKFTGSNYNLIVDDKVFASSKNSVLMKVLYNRLLSYCERYRRTDDTFDIIREVKIINKEIGRGKYNNFSLNKSTVSTMIGYPTYTS